MTHHDVVLCHAPEDQAIADRMSAVLEQERIPCWIAPRDIPAEAEARDAAVLDAIASSRLVVLVFSRNADASVRIPLELEAASARGIPVLPVRVEEVTPSGSLRHLLDGSHWLDAVAPPVDDHLHHLAGYVRALLDRDDTPPGPVPVAVSAAGTTAAPFPSPSTSPSPSPYGPAAGSGPPAGGPLPGGPRTPVATPSGPVSGDASPPSPEGRSSGVRWALIALVALGLVIVGAVVTLTVLFAIPTEPVDEAQSGSGTEAEEDGADSDPDAGLSERACELLDPADVIAVYGADADPGTPASGGYCEFATVASITIFEEPADAGSLALYRSVTAGEITDLPDLGEGAFLDEEGFLTVLDEDRDALLLLYTIDNSPTGRQQLVDLAELIVADS